MKNSIKMLLVLAAVMFATTTGAYAVPTVDGVLGAGEYVNIAAPSAGPYPFYLQVTDPNEGGVPDSFDITRVTLLQELTAVSGDGDMSNDGVYLAIETAAPSSLADGDGFAPLPIITMGLDFDGGGTDIQLIHYNTSPGGGLATDVVEVCLGAGACFPGAATNITLAGAGPGPGGGVGAFSRGIGASHVIEYFLPTGLFGTPPGVPLPFAAGGIFYDNGIAAPDDAVFAVVPEPGTVLMLGAGLLGLVGYRRFFN